jgi:hypothetical protein
MTDRELMKWALYALEGSNAYDWPVVEELKERLAQPEQEPVAWVSESENLLSWDKFYDHMTPLYTAPRQWQGLTDKEIERACVPLGAAMLSFTEVARAIEAKLRERNA